MTDSANQPIHFFQSEQLNLNDFEAAKIVELAAEHVDRNVHELCNVFAAAKNKTTGRAFSALELLAGICSMMLVPEKPTNPYRPMVQWGDGTGSMALEHIPRDVTLALSQLIDVIDNPALQARIADVVWLRDRSNGHQIAATAIRAYRAHPISEDTWHNHGRACWHRALQLAKQIRAEDELAMIEASLLGAFFSAAADPDCGY